MGVLEAKWAESPILTTREIATEMVGEIIYDAAHDALDRFKTTPEHKLIALVGRFACSGTWNEGVIDICYRTATKLRTTLDDVESAPVQELYSLPRVLQTTREHSGP